MDKFFEKIPFLGFYNSKCKKFVDIDIFESQYQKYIRLSKVKIWYGTSGEDPNYKENISGQYILGIQCDYQNPITGEKKQTKMNCGKLTSNDIITKEIELTEGDYICKFYLCYNDIISYIKFETKKGKYLEVGKYDKDCEKTILFNTDKVAHMIQSFHGYFNDYGLRSLGCVHLKRQNYFFLNLIDVFRYRYLIKNNQEERDKWTPEKIQALNDNQKAFINLCLLPDSRFYCVIKFCC